MYKYIYECSKCKTLITIETDLEDLIGSPRCPCGSRTDWVGSKSGAV